MSHANRLSWAVILAAFLFIAADKHTEEFRGKVVGITDGDTITVLDSDDVQHKVRLVGIDAPESNQDFGTAARQHLAHLIFQKTVLVRWQEPDKYGRTLGAIYLDDKLINLVMLEDGLAWHYKKHSNVQAFADAEEAARKAMLGLWAAPNPIPPWEFREREDGSTKATAAFKSPPKIHSPKPTPTTTPVPLPVLDPPSLPTSNNGMIWVNGYTRKNGTKVKGYWRKR